MPKKPETLFKEKVLRDLASLPHTWAEKIQQVGIRGTPDILACIGGNFVAIELKRSVKEKADPLQEYKLKCIVEAGGHAFVVDPSGWEALFKFFREKILAGAELKKPKH